MFLQDFDKYKTQHENGIKKISLRCSYPKILKDPIDLKFQKAYDNFDLVFNRNGHLLYSVHTERNKKYKLIYGYNHNGVLVSAMSLLSEKNELISLSEFRYDENGRIEREIVRSFYHSLDYNVISECIHTYKENIHEILMTSDNDDENCTFYYTYDNQKRVIEEMAIRGENELVYWKKNQYDKDDVLIKETLIGENGEPDGVYEFLPVINGMTTGYHYKSNDTNYLREYSFTFNETGHWVNQVVLNDGDPIYFYDRIIEYY